MQPFLRPLNQFRPLLLAILLISFTHALLAAEIVIGQAAPLTGVLAKTGQDMVLGARIYFEHINASGGIHGARIRHVVLDDGYKVAETVSKTRELIERHGAVALIGMAGTANLGEVQKQGVLQAAGIALVAPYTGGDSLRGEDNANIFHIRASYGDETEHMIDHLTTVGITRIAVFHQNDGFGASGREGVEKALARRNLKLWAAASYERNTDDVAAAVEIIRATEPGAVVMISVNRSTAAFAKAYRAAGGSGQLLNISVVDPAELVRLAGLDNVHGLGITQVMPFPYSATLPVTREFRTLFARHAPKEATISYTSFEEFIGAKLLVEALRRAGPAPTAEKVLRALTTLSDYDAGGFALSYGPRRRVGSRFVEITMIGRNGAVMR